MHATSNACATEPQEIDKSKTMRNSFEENDGVSGFRLRKQSIIRSFPLLIELRCVEPKPRLRKNLDRQSNTKRLSKRQYFFQPKRQTHLGGASRLLDTESRVAINLRAHQIHEDDRFVAGNDGLQMSLLQRSWRRPHADQTGLAMRLSAIPPSARGQVTGSFVMPATNLLPLSNGRLQWPHGLWQS
jgi:hypothetical protein